MQASTGPSKSGAQETSVERQKQRFSATLKTLVLSMLSVLPYRCESCKRTKGEETKLDIFQTKCLRRILSAGDDRRREGEKEEMVLDWRCPEERSEQLLPLDGSQRGREAEADSKLLSVAL